MTSLTSHVPRAHTQTRHPRTRMGKAVLGIALWAALHVGLTSLEAAPRGPIVAPAPLAEPVELGYELDEGGPCDISWLQTEEGLATRLPGAQAQREARLRQKLRIPFPDWKTQAMKVPQKAITPVERSSKVLVVMVEYPDLTFSSAGETSNATHEEWRRRVLGYSLQPDGQSLPDSSIPSLVDFWHEASFGHVSFYPAPERFDAAAAAANNINAPDALANDGVVHVKIPLQPYTLGYYWPLQAASEYLYISTALKAADPYVDFKSFDTNQDGIVDHGELALLLVWANPNQEEKGDWIWPHRTALPPKSLYLDGVSVAGGDPSITPEMHGGSYLAVDQYRPDRTIHHEFGHDLGLPDLYNVSATGERHNDGIGYWGVMASSEALPEGWSRVQLGWVSESDGTLVRLSGSGDWDLTIPSLSAGQLQPGMVVTIEHAGTFGNEYFLLENRRWEGKYDSILPGEGLLIYHVYDNRVLYRISATNLGTGRKIMGLKVMEADGLWNLMDPNDDNKGDAGDPYQPGGRFAPDTTPGAFWYDGSNAQIYLDNLEFLDESGTFGASLCVGPFCNL